MKFPLVKGLADICATRYIPFLVAKIGGRGTSAADQTRAAHDLWICSINPAYHGKIIAAGAIPPLVALLSAQSSCWAVQEAAARTLGELALNAEIQATIKSDSRSYPSLLKLMSTSASADVRLAAKLALRRLSSAPPGEQSNRIDEADKRVHEAIAAEENRTAKATVSAREKAAKKEASETAVKAAALAASSPAGARASQQTGPSWPSPSLRPDPSASAPASDTVAAAATPMAISQQQQPPPRLRKSCWSCSATGAPLKKCSGCAAAAYCSVGCQNADWKAHKEQCAGLKAGTALASAGVAERGGL